MNEDFTIIVQGHTNDISLSRLDTYKRYGDVIVSCWYGDFIPQHIQNSISSKIPDHSFANPQNIYMQATTILSGLKLAQTSYFIKVRSDEYYENLQPIIDKVLANPLKYICNNIWFEKVDSSWMHPGDHLIAGSVDIFKKTFENVLSI